MKKFLMISFICVMLNLPSFAASWQIQEARDYYAKGQYEQALKSVTNAINSSSSNDPSAYQLRMDIYIKLGVDKNLKYALEDVNKLIKLTNIKSLYKTRGYINIGLGNYEQALQDFGNSLEKGVPNSTRDANTGFITIAQDVKAPLNARISALNMIGYIYEKNGKYNDSIAAIMKSVQLIALAPETDPVFKNNSKETIIKQIKTNILQQQVPYTDVLDKEVFEGIFEYCMGNKELGTKIANGAINEAVSRGNSTKANKLRTMFNYVKKALDNGLPNNTL